MWEPCTPRVRLQVAYLEPPCVESIDPRAKQGLVLSSDGAAVGQPALAQGAPSHEAAAAELAAMLRRVQVRD